MTTITNRLKDLEDREGIEQMLTHLIPSLNSSAFKDMVPNWRMSMMDISPQESDSRGKLADLIIKLIEGTEMADGDYPVLKGVIHNDNGVIDVDMFIVIENGDLKNSQKHIGELRYTIVNQVN